MNDLRFQAEALRLWKKLTPKAKTRAMQHIRSLLTENTETNSQTGRTNDG